MNHKKLHNRAEKVKFLKDIQAGKASVSDLHPHQIVGLRQRWDEPDRIIIAETGKEMTAA